MTSRSRLLLVLVWLVGAVVATSIGLLAVGQVASQVGDPAVPVLSDGGAAAATPTSAASPERSPTASAAASPNVAPPAPSAVAPVRRSASFRSAGGTVGVQCSGSAPSLVYATPADGYSLDERSIEGSKLEVRFESGDRRVKMTIRCANGQPRLVDVKTDDD